MHFEELVENVEKGNSYRITRRGKPVAMLGPVEEHESGYNIRSVLSIIREKRSSYGFSHKEIDDFKTEGRKY